MDAFRVSKILIRLSVVFGRGKHSKPWFDFMNGFSSLKGMDKCILRWEESEFYGSIKQQKMNKSFFIRENNR